MIAPGAVAISIPLAWPWVQQEPHQLRLWLTAVRVRLKLDEHHAARRELPRLLTKVLAIRALIGLAISNAKYLG
jgi:hypothetical protein